MTNRITSCKKLTILKIKVITVVDLHLSRDKHTFLNDTDWLKLVKNIQLRDFKTTDPEYGFVLGAFGAFGNPASFHSKEIYALRYILCPQAKIPF